VIGYYVHHQGLGHLHRALAIAEHLSTPLTIVSSLPAPPGCRLPWLRLPRDDEAPHAVDVEAGGTLHWAPRHDEGLGARAAMLTSWLAQERPELVVVDVSVEVALLARLAGVPVVVMAMPGERRDRAHAMAYDLAETLIAGWPPDIAVSAWPAAWTRKTHFVGGFSRFDGHRDAKPPARIGSARSAFALWGAGGTSLPASLMDNLSLATPGWHWDVRATSGELDAEAIWIGLHEADVVVSHGGEAAVAEIAAARRPAVLVADDRPFDEQRHTVNAIDRAGLAVGLNTWPEVYRWPGLLQQAVDIGGSGWRRWSYGDGARRAAEVLIKLTDNLPASGGNASE
jgi:hypothetical protein